MKMHVKSINQDIILNIFIPHRETKVTVFIYVVFFFSLYIGLYVSSRGRTLEKSHRRVILYVCIYSMREKAKKRINKEKQKKRKKKECY